MDVMEHLETQCLCLVLLFIILTHKALLLFIPTDILNICTL